MDLKHMCMCEQGYTFIDWIKCEICNACDSDAFHYFSQLTENGYNFLPDKNFLMDIYPLNILCWFSQQVTKTYTKGSLTDID